MNYDSKEGKHENFLDIDGVLNTDKQVRMNNLDTNILLEITPVINTIMKPDLREKEILNWLTTRCLSFRGLTSENAEEAILKVK